MRESARSVVSSPSCQQKVTEISTNNRNWSGWLHPRLDIFWSYHCRPRETSVMPPLSGRNRPEVNHTRVHEEIYTEGLVLRRASTDVATLRTWVEIRVGTGQRWALTRFLNHGDWANCVPSAATKSLWQSLSPRTSQQNFLHGRCLKSDGRCSGVTHTHTHTHTQNVA